MKKIGFHIYTAWLMVLLALSACVDGVDQVVYEYAPVKTEFALFVPETFGKNGRMIEEVVRPQAASFGMEKMYLFPFELNNSPRQLTANSKLQGDNVLHSGNNQVETANRVSGTSSIWFDDVSVPLKTNYFLMYGVQPRSVSMANDRFGLNAIQQVQQPGFQDGSTVTNLHGEEVKSPQPLSMIRFAPSPIFERNFFSQNTGARLQSDLYYFYQKRREWVLAYLTRLVGAGDVGNYWYNTANPELQQLYREWVGTLPDGHSMSASSKTILGLVDQLHRQLTNLENKIKVQTPVADSPEEAQQKKDIALIQAIKTAITAEYSSTQYGDFRVQIETATPGETGDAAYPLKYKTGTDPLFPVAVGLPDGALQVIFTPQNDKAATVHFYHELKSDPIEDIYAYPAQQYYTSRSEIGVSGKKQKELFVSGMKWADFVDPKNQYFVDDYVFPFARTLVLKTPVRFGMANLSTRVRFKRGEIQDFEGASVTVPSISQSQFETASNQAALLHENITLTGILVSDQKEVGWDFTRESAAADPQTYIVYDKMLNASLTGKYQSKMFVTRDDFPAVSPNETLLYPSKVLQAGESDRIFVVLEFENGKQSFHGMGGVLIPAYSRFYLSYMLDARSLGLENGKQLFSSAEMVDLQLTITGLSGAYNVVPDTRKIHVNLGIAANIKWGDGFVFEDVPVQNQ